MTSIQDKISYAKEYSGKLTGSYNGVINYSFEPGEKIALLWSGGKDSYHTMLKAIDKGLKVELLVNLIFKKQQIGATWPFNYNIIKKQAEALGIKIVFLILHEIRKKKAQESLKIVKENGIFNIGVSCIDPKGQRELIQKMVKKESMKVFEPLCGRNSEELLLNIIESGLKAIIVSVDYQKMSPEWIGKTIDRRFYEYLKLENKRRVIDYCGENGEFQTFVYDGPLFKKKLVLGESEVIKNGTQIVLYIKNTKLKDKNL